MAIPNFSLVRFGLLAQLAPYHLMLYGTLLGTELYQVHRPQPSNMSSTYANPNPRVLL